MMMQSVHVPALATGALAFAGFDPCGGAGALADCRTFEACGFCGFSILTAITVQGPRSVTRIEKIPGSIIRQSAALLAQQTRVTAIKIGMLATKATVKAVADACRNFPGVPIVLDPVLAASSGMPLIDEPGIEAMKRLLFPMAAVITPNVPEAAALTGLDVRDENTAFLAAERLLQSGAGSIVVKGGHLEGEPNDFLLNRQGRQVFRAGRIQGPDHHGTGCVFSSALAALLGSGQSVGEAVRGAKTMVAERINKAAGT